MKLSEIISAIAASVYDAHAAIERNAAAGFLSMFSGDEELSPDKKVFSIPVPSGGSMKIDVPLAVLCRHDSLRLSDVSVRLKVKLEADGSALNAAPCPLADEGGQKDDLTEIELVFKSDLPPEGISRLVERMNSKI